MGVALSVSSNSMWPLISAGDTVELIRSEEYRSGDIITYYTSFNKVLTHRVLKIDATSFVTKGDLSEKTEHSEDRSRILGKVKTINSNHRRIDLERLSNNLFYKLYVGSFSVFASRRMQIKPLRPLFKIGTISLTYILYLILLYAFSFKNDQR
jgi:hypothetical protein